MTEADDGVRSDVGIVVSAVEKGGGRVRLVFDDAVRDPSVDFRRWRPVTLFTWNEYAESALAAMTLTTEEFAAIGEAVVVRLQALRKRTPSPP